MPSEEILILEEDTDGWEAPVHQSLLEPIRIAGAPYKPAVANIGVGFILMFGMHFWYYFFVAVAVHILLVIATRRDIYLVDTLHRYFTYASYYGVH
jgi:type IV secretion system protein VirB3